MAKQGKLSLILLGSLLWLSAGCGRTKDPDSLNLMDPVALDKYIVYIDKTRDDAYLLDVLSKKSAPGVKTIELPRAPSLLERRKSSAVEELLVLCRGQEEEVGKPSQSAQLAVLDSQGVNRKYPLKSRFNALIQSEDGSVAILYFDESKGDESGGDLSRRNEVAIVDLASSPVEQGAKPNPVFRQLDSDDGSAPRALVISPIVSVVGQARRLAVAFFQGQVSLLDLSHLEEGRKEIKIPFNNLIAASPVLFTGSEPSANANEEDVPATMYLRSEQTDDIYIVDLPPATESKANDFWPNIKTRKSGGVASDIALYKDVQTDGASTTRLTRLLVVSQQAQKVSIIDPAGNVSYVSLGFPANRALIYHAAAPFDETIAPRALLYNDSSAVSMAGMGVSGTIGFLDLVRVQERGAQNLETKVLTEAFSPLLSLNEQDVALVYKKSGVSLLNLADRTIDPFKIGGLVDVVLDPLANNLWLPSSPGAPERIQLGFIHVDTRDPGYVLLDASVQKVIPVTSGDEQRVVVIHPSKVGYVTVLDAKEPKRDTAVSLQGFFLADVLD